ncbi:MAG: chromosome segregation protein SMC, partial [Rhodoferax sp.]|nr:chromosome segregation protein SMC [Rhodoferax sp.]
LLKFNPYFNALIGGRGTGKSTVIHALRLAYRRETELAAGTEAKQTFERFNKVARNRAAEGGLQTGTHICLQLNRDGIRYQLLWSQNTQGPVVKEWDDSTATFRTSSSQAISPQRFPVRLFSQGQIAALAGDSQQSLLKVMDDAAGTATQQAGFEAAKQAFFSTRAQLRELDGKLVTADALQVELQDVQRKLARFEAADHAVVLKNFQRTNRQSRELEHQFQHASELAKRLTGFAQELLAEDIPDGMFDAIADQLALKAIQQLHSAISEVRKQLETAAANLAKQSADLHANVSRSDWIAQLALAKTAYDKLKSDLLEQGIHDPAEYGRLVQEKQILENKFKTLETLRARSSELEAKTKVQLEEVLQARQAITRHRQQYLGSTLKENPYVRMELVPYSRDARTIDRSLREILGTSEGTFEDDLYGEPKDGGANVAKGAVADLLAVVQITDSPGAWA